MRLEDVKFGMDYLYVHRESGRKCYVHNCDVDDGAYLLVRLYNEEGDDESDQIVGTDAAGLDPISP
jgi:hypothetical protein